MENMIYLEEENIYEPLYLSYESIEEYENMEDLERINNKSINADDIPF